MQAGTNITFTSTPSLLGHLLLAVTERGICAVKLGDHAAELEADLRRQFPRCPIRRDEAGLASWLGQVVDHLEGRLPQLNLPVDVEGTPFQERVWQALRTIPYGQTRSYGAIAMAVGKPRAVRAVGRACGSNPVAVLIPCHRAIRSDGGLGGYYWGVQRKEKLLMGERAGGP